VQDSQLFIFELISSPAGAPKTQTMCASSESFREARFQIDLKQWWRSCWNSKTVALCIFNPQKNCETQTNGKWETGLSDDKHHVAYSSHARNLAGESITSNYIKFFPYAKLPFTVRSEVFSPGPKPSNID
jgi:hypothetical protein